jgi:trans-aconitate methyltransferase
MLNGELFRAPISKNVQRVLDVGTGTGIWAIDFADEFPSAQVIGNDLSPIQPSFVPPNCSFEIDDCESAWPYRQGQGFDFIHMRSMAGSITDWPRLFRQAFEHMNPGGWIEIQEYAIQMHVEEGDENMPETIANWLAETDRASKIINKTMNVVGGLREDVIKAGFTATQEDIYKVSPF